GRGAAMIFQAEGVDGGRTPRELFVAIPERVAPLRRAIDLHRVGRHSPTLAPRQLDAHWLAHAATSILGDRSAALRKSTWARMRASLAWMAVRRAFRTRLSSSSPFTTPR